mmetsp:Transcript_26609/g.54207  ORF Transcript_26609/g.54207 Transcript_26609/m.54207 type:complete len:204 (+) Transcript_26609:1249-1860(+)
MVTSVHARGGCVMGSENFGRKRPSSRPPPFARTTSLKAYQRNSAAMPPTSKIFQSVNVRTALPLRTRILWSTRVSRLTTMITRRTPFSHKMSVFCAGMETNTGTRKPSAQMRVALANAMGRFVSAKMESIRSRWESRIPLSARSQPLEIRTLEYSRNAYAPRPSSPRTQQTCHTPHYWKEPSKRHLISSATVEQEVRMKRSAA